MFDCLVREDEDEDQEEEEEEVPEPLPSTSQCILYLEKIENYLNHFDKEGATTESLNDIKRFLLSNRAKSCVQKKITDMFK